MKAIDKYIIYVFAAVLLLSGACKKEEVAPGSVSPDQAKIYQDENVRWALGAVAGEGVVLLVYADNYGQYQFKMIDNAGTEIWKKTFGYTYDALNNQLPQMNILYDSDETFAIFQGNGLKKINRNGDIVFEDSAFIKGRDLNNAEIADIMLGNNDNYLIMGNFYLSGSRAFVSEYSRSNGQEQFFKIYAINVLGINAYTSGFKNSNGGYSIAGSFSSNTIGLNSAIFLSTFDANGFLLKTTQTEVENFACYGRELLTLSNGNLGYLLSPVIGTSLDQRSRIYELNPVGEVIAVDYLDLAAENYGAGNQPFFGTGLVLNSDGKYTGLMKTASEIKVINGNFFTTTYGQPHYGYCYKLSENAKVISQSYLNRNYSNFFNALVRMSNGQILLYGTTVSFGEQMKLTTIVL